MKQKRLELIRIKNLNLTVRILHESTSTSIDSIVVSNRKVVPHFEEIIEFLCDLNLFNKERIQFTIPGNYLLDEERLKAALLEKILKKGNPYFEFLVDYLCRFEEKEGGLLCLDKHSPANQWGSGLRDLFLELGVLRAEEKDFRISIDFKEIIESKLRGKFISPTALKRKQEKNKKIADDAENLVLLLERKRLRGFPHLLTRVERISLVNAGAGYDIRSFAIPAEYGDPFEISIEVKAVSPMDWKFYWSKTEIGVAQKRGEKYLLYLVPIFEGKPNAEKIKVISNPIDEVLKQEIWLREIESTSFWKKSAKTV